MTSYLGEDIYLQVKHPGTSTVLRVNGDTQNPKLELVSNSNKPLGQRYTIVNHETTDGTSGYSALAFLSADGKAKYHMKDGSSADDPGNNALFTIETPDPQQPHLKRFQWYNDNAIFIKPDPNNQPYLTNGTADGTEMFEVVASNPQVTFYDSSNDTDCIAHSTTAPYHLSFIIVNNDDDDQRTIFEVTDEAMHVVFDRKVHWSDPSNAQVKQRESHLSLTASNGKILQLSEDGPTVRLSASQVPQSFNGGEKFVFKWSAGTPPSGKGEVNISHRSGDVERFLARVGANIQMTTGESTAAKLRCRLRNRELMAFKIYAIDSGTGTSSTSNVYTHQERLRTDGTVGSTPPQMSLYKSNSSPSAYKFQGSQAQNINEHRWALEAKSQSTTSRRVVTNHTATVDYPKFNIEVYGRRHVALTHVDLDGTELLARTTYNDDFVEFDHRDQIKADNTEDDGYYGKNSDHLHWHFEQ